MKRIIIISLSILLVGCSREQPTNTALLEAEQFVHTAPQKTLEIIYDTDTAGMAEADMALYGLLLTEATQKSGVVLATDSLMARSLKFFQRNGNRERYARTLLRKGIMDYSRQQYADAISYIKQAEQLAKREDKCELLYDVYSTLADINAETNGLDKALHYYRLTLDAAHEANNPNWQALAMAQLATIHGRAGDNAWKNTYISKCQPLLKLISRHERAVVLTALADLNMRIGYTLTAKQQLEEAFLLEQLQETCLLMGDLCQQKKNMKEAVDYWYMALNGIDQHAKTEAYKRLIDHFDRQKDYVRTADLSQRLNRLYASTGNLQKPYDLATLQNQFEADVRSRQFYRGIIALLSTVLVLFVTVALLVLYHRRRMNHFHRIIDQLNNDYATDLAHYRHMQTELADMQQQKMADAQRISQKQREIEQLEQKLADYQEDRQRPQHWNVENSLLNAEPVYHLHTLAAKGRNASHDDWQEVYALMPNFMAKLSRYDLSAKEQSVCALVKLRFIPSEMASLTSSSPQSITNLRVRLHERIFGSKGGARDFDQKIRAL